MKKIIIITCSLLLIVISAIMLLPLRAINENDFELSISYNDISYSIGEELIITANLKYRESMFIPVNTLNSPINITITTNEDPIIYLLIPKSLILTPYKNVSITKKYMINSTNTIYITAYTEIYIGDSTFIYKVENCIDNIIT